MVTLENLKLMVWSSFTRSPEVINFFYVTHCTKMKFFIKDFYSESGQICIFLRIWSHLLKKSLMEHFIFCTVTFDQRCCLEYLESVWWYSTHMRRSQSAANINSSSRCYAFHWKIYYVVVKLCFKLLNRKWVQKGAV